jgi:phosphotransferase system HPr (HPr) family protein
MLELKIKIINQLGLHARAAAQLVKLCSKFNSTIKINRLDSNLEADAKSILSILTLAAPCGTTLNITINGFDEEIALAEIEQLFNAGFGEL